MRNRKIIFEMMMALLVSPCKKKWYQNQWSALISEKSFIFSHYPLAQHIQLKLEDIYLFLSFSSLFLLLAFLTYYSTLLYTAGESYSFIHSFIDSVIDYLSYYVSMWLYIHRTGEREREQKTYIHRYARVTQVSFKANFNK